MEGPREQGRAGTPVAAPSNQASSEAARSTDAAGSSDATGGIKDASNTAPAAHSSDAAGGGADASYTAAAAHSSDAAGGGADASYTAAAAQSTDAAAGSPDAHTRAPTRAEVFEAMMSFDVATQALMFKLTTSVIDQDAYDPSYVDEDEQARRIGDLLQQGEVYKAFPLQCQEALVCLYAHGSEHPASLAAVYAVYQNLFQRQLHLFAPDCAVWLLPRAAAQWGIGHADTRRLAQQAALCLCHLPDPRDEPQLLQIATELVQQLPGGIGWGAVASTPLADEDAYCRNAVMMTQASKALNEGRHQLAKEMAKRCVAYFGTLGPHWLGTPRKMYSMLLHAQAALKLEGDEAGERLLQECKRACIRELGTDHEVTLDVQVYYAYLLRKLKRFDKSRSLFQRTLQRRQEALGRDHITVIECEATLACALMDVRQEDEVVHKLRSIWEAGVRVAGPRGKGVADSLRAYWLILHNQLKWDEAEAVRQRAARMGCDVSVCDPNDSPAGQYMSRMLHATMGMSLQE